MVVRELEARWYWAVMRELRQTGNPELKDELAAVALYTDWPRLRCRACLACGVDRGPVCVFDAGAACPVKEDKCVMSA